MSSTRTLSKEAVALDCILITIWTSRTSQTFTWATSPPRRSELSSIRDLPTPGSLTKRLNQATCISLTTIRCQPQHRGRRKGLSFLLGRGLSVDTSISMISGLAAASIVSQLPKYLSRTKSSETLRRRTASSARTSMQSSVWLIPILQREVSHQSSTT